jgi:hypothetical protein
MMQYYSNSFINLIWPLSLRFYSQLLYVIYSTLIKNPQRKYLVCLTNPEIEEEVIMS